MHTEVREYVRKWATTDPAAMIVELGSRNTSGERIRDLFAGTRYLGVDAVAGVDVDVVANAADWRPDEPVDLVVCCEMFEHTPRWREVVANSFHMLRPGGRAVFTCAGPERRVHGVNHDDPDQPGYYQNVTPEELWIAMDAAGFVDTSVRSVPHRSTHLGGTDTQGTGQRPEDRETGNVVLTCLLTSQPDPQRQRRWEPDPAILDTWADSIRGATAVVLMDEPAPYPAAVVQRVESSLLNPYYARWHHYRRWLAEYPDIGKVWITDGSDVEMLREPWGHMEPGTLYVGSEPEVVGCSWMRVNHHDPTIAAWIRRNARLPLLNAGLVGGHREVVMRFVEHLCRDLDRFPDDSDMGAFNFTAYGGRFDARVETGPRIHTVFKANADNGQAFWRHR